MWAVWQNGLEVFVCFGLEEAVCFDWERTLHFFLKFNDIPTDLSITIDYIFPYPGLETGLVSTVRLDGS